MPVHLNVYHQLSLLREAVRHKNRSFYVHNTPQVRDTFAQLQKYGYIGRFLAVHEPYDKKHARRLNKKKIYKERTSAPYLLVFNKFRLSNKNLPVIGGISYEERPVAIKRPLQTKDMKIFRQGMGVEFMELENGYFLPSHLCKLRGIDAFKGFKIWS